MLKIGNMAIKNRKFSKCIPQGEFFAFFPLLASYSKDSLLS